MDGWSAIRKLARNGVRGDHVHTSSNGTCENQRDSLRRVGHEVVADNAAFAKLISSVTVKSMHYWRMSFRVGTGGYPMWPDCLRLGVAAMTYKSLAETDLSKYLPGEPKSLWSELKPSQKASLRRVAYEMAEGDVIFAKDGPMIVDRGVVTGPYSFDSELRMPDPNGVPWAHQVPVDWSRRFTPIKILLGRSQQLTVEELTSTEVERMINKVEGTIVPSHDLRDEDEYLDTLRAGDLIEDGYYRESPARLKFIVPRHNKLSNSFCRWLENVHKAKATQEKHHVDICFKLKQTEILAELKICFGVGTTKSIREALGQLLEYNHYPPRKEADAWLIILDEEPSTEDRLYIHVLRDKRSMPITIGWQTRDGFSFDPKWPVQT